MKLDVHSQIKIVHKQQKKVKQEHKHVGVGRKRKGLTMYAYDTDKQEIYIVKLEKKAAYDVSLKEEKAAYKAIVNPEHPHLYALNFKNAKRKFKKLLSNRK